MNINELMEKAEELGIDPGSIEKPNLIRAIQKAEGHDVCFGDNNDGHCEYSDCCFWSDCIVCEAMKI